MMIDQKLVPIGFVQSEASLKASIVGFLSPHGANGIYSCLMAVLDGAKIIRHRY
ncbi:hypothetical protein KAR91_47235 [Candidatus Pacearchaeota archaeon]|nr:hypothetical protein [Candidatus Pacearchaeota archaeon]